MEGMEFSYGWVGTFTIHPKSSDVLTYTFEYRGVQYRTQHTGGRLIQSGDKRNGEAMRISR